MRTLAALVAVLALTGCVHKAPPNVGIATLDSFPKTDSLGLIQNLRENRIVVVGTIVETERRENYEDMCAIICRMRGGSEPNRFYYSKILADSTISGPDATKVKTGGDRWVAWGVPPEDWMPGVGLRALFLLRKHCWEDLEKMRMTRTQASSYIICDTMWSLARLEDVVDPIWWEFAWRHRSQLGTFAE